MIALIPAEVWAFLSWALGALAVGGGLWVMGRREGTQSARIDASEQVSQDLITAKEVDDEIQSKDDAAVRDALAKWMRK
jgi:predicted 2-oxoglutarate/Fe(II)-dependent dioxygenase YbiX